MKLLLIPNREAWAVGTLARLFVLGAPSSWQVRIISSREMSANPTRFAEWIAWADMTHWMLHKTFPAAEPFLSAGVHVTGVYHIETDERDFEYLRRADRLLVHAQHYGRRLVELGCDESRIDCLPLPVDDGFFRKTARKRAPASTSAAGRRFSIGFFAAAEYESGRKGMNLLPQILQRLREKGIAARLVVSGLGWVSILKRPEFAGLPIEHVVTPSYFDMPSAYASLDVYLCLSSIEGGPMPVFEALACGVPVVSTTVGNIPDYLVPGESYREIPQNDADAAADALEAVYRDPAAHASMSAAGCDAIAEPLSIRTYQRRLVEFYAKAAGISDIPPCAGERGVRQRILRHRWRAWDRTYWAKECWRMGRRDLAIRFLLQAALLNPLCAGLWRTVGRALGMLRDEVPLEG